MKANVAGMHTGSLLALIGIPDFFFTAWGLR